MEEGGTEKFSEKVEESKFCAKVDDNNYVGNYNDDDNNNDCNDDYDDNNDDNHNYEGYKLKRKS